MTSWDARGRALHLVDIENLVGSPRPHRAEVAEVHYAYTRRFVRPGDLLTVACNHGAAPLVAWEWPGARLLLRSGADGADRALLEVIQHEAVHARFASVHIASGDGIFTDAAARLGAYGVVVTVVARPGSLSRTLRMAAGSFQLLDLAPVGELAPRGSA